MKELDLLKENWKKNENSFKQVTNSEIYKMIHLKSSSIVKWIFIISLFEVLFWISLSVFIDTDTYLKEVNRPDMIVYLRLFDILNYSVILVFIYLFYKNYTTISTTATTKALMRSILKTRKIVQFYVGYNLIMLLLGSVFSIFILFTSNPEFANFNEKLAQKPETILLTLVILALVVIGLMAILWGIYRLIYGKLLRRLYANYKELKKIEF